MSRHGSNRKGAGVGLCLFGVLGISGCDNNQIAPGATISISPESRNIQIVENLNEDDVCQYNPDLYMDMPLVVALSDAGGVPLGRVDVDIYADFTENSFGGSVYPLGLYIDTNGNGVIDEESEYVSSSEDGVLTVETSRYGGEALVLLRVNVSCTYRGQVFAYAGMATGVMEVEVSASATE